MACCTQITPSGLGGLGIIPSPTDIAGAIDGARDLWNTFQQMFGIGAGRREADVVTPIIDKLHHTILAPAVELAEHASEHTCAEFQQMLSVGNQAFAQAVGFLTNTEWQDGRAAEKGLYWILGPQHTIDPELMAEVGEPWGYKIWTAFKQDVANKCAGSGIIGGGSIGTIFTDPTTGGINWPVVLGVGGLAYMILKRK